MPGRGWLVWPCPEGEDQLVDLYVYDQGDTIWLVQGPTDVVEVTLANPPEPLPSERPPATE